MKIAIRVKPGSRENRVSFENSQIVVRVKAPAQEGKANKELIAFLSEVLKVSKSHIIIAGGLGSPFKRLEMPSDACAKLQALASGHNDGANQG